MTTNDDDRPARAETPQDRLGRIAAAMTDTLEAHPEHTDDVHAIVLLYSGKRAMAHLHGYEDDIDAVTDMLVHLRAIMRANGKDLEVIAIPENAAGAE